MLVSIIYYFNNTNLIFVNKRAMSLIIKSISLKISYITRLIVLL